MSKLNKYVPGKGYVLQNDLVEPKDEDNFNEMNIVLFNGGVIDDIVDECKPFAVNSEFQVHYHSLQARIENGEHKVTITVPLAFYNFPQEVTSGSVSMEMKDVKIESDKAKKLIDDKLEELFEKVPLLKGLSALGFNVSYTVSDNGSIHRHPGDFGFSQTDYDKDPEEPGVIYRQMKAKDLYQTDSVLYIPYHNNPHLVCTETRIVNVEPVPKNGGIKGIYTEIPTISFLSKADTFKDHFANILGGSKEVLNIFEKFEATTSMKIEVEKYPLVEELLTQFYKSDYKHDISTVDGKHIEQERRVYYNQTKKKSKTQSHLYSESYGYSYGYDEWDWEDFVEKEYESLTQDEPEEKEEKKEPSFAFIGGKEMVYNEEWASWLPRKTLDMTERELIDYLDENNMI